MKKRVFLGFRVSKELSKAILDWQRSTNLIGSANFVSRNNLHMTLIPPWYEQDIDKVKSLLLKIISEHLFYPFKIEFHKVKPLLVDGKLRLLWLEGNKSVQLEFLRNRLLKSLGIKRERRIFIPHITLVRFKKGEVLRNCCYFFDSLKFLEYFSEIAIFESGILRGNSSYNVIAKIKL